MVFTGNSGIFNQEVLSDKEEVMEVKDILNDCKENIRDFIQKNSD